MSKELELPVEEFKQFVNAAGKWLATTSDAKQSKLELRFGKHAGKLHLSVGGDSSFIECILNVQAEEAIETPFWLDLQYLMKFDFKVEKLTLIVPSSMSAAKTEERRAQFKSPGLNFRIPLRSGDAWKRNSEDIGASSKAAPGLGMKADFLNQIAGWLKLPNSFKVNSDPCVTIESTRPGHLAAYEYDFGAYWHQFTLAPADHIGAFQRAVFRYRFFLPYEAVEDQADLIEIRQTDRQSFGQVAFKEGTQFLLYRWSEPNSTKPKDHIPSSVEAARKSVESSLAFDGKELLKNVTRVLSFHSDKESEEDAIQFSILKGLKQYSLDNRNEKARILVDGQALEEAFATLRVLIQGKCLRDYLKFFTLDAPVGMEICRSSIILYQQDQPKGISLLYWAPIQER